MSKATATRSGNDLSATVERLKASRETLMRSLSDEAVRYGREWAMDAADYGQLSRLMIGFGEDSEITDNIILNRPEDAYSWAEHIYFHIEPDCIRDRQASRDFWTTWAGEDEPNPSDGFVHGFVRGAAEVWEQVKDQI